MCFHQIGGTVQPDLDYCSSSWSDGTPGVSNEKFALRSIVGLKARQPNGDTKNHYRTWSITP